jgi:TRAP-type mannitol/chloroaromatic compound transport system permease large subunit
VPLVLPIFNNAGVDPVWLAMLITVQPADLVPDATLRLGTVLPAGRDPARGDDAPHLHGVAPVVGLQILGIVLVFFFPAIATWLPKAIGW